MAWITPHGYRMLKVDGRQIFEHRRVVEQALRRRLTTTEIVHHLDGNKLNNVLSNLEVTTQGIHAHSHLYRGGRKRTLVTCCICTRDFVRIGYVARTCSRPCRARLSWYSRKRRAA